MRILSNLKNGIGFACLLALPIGVYQGNPDSANVSVGAYGGTGQYAAIIRSCEGETAKSENKFKDVAGAAYVRIPVTGTWSESPIVLGLRAGTFGSDFNPPTYSWNAPAYPNANNSSIHFTYSYFNPNLSFEFEDLGFGMGYLFKPVPDNFSDDVHWTKHATGHVRLGKPHRFHVYGDYNESLPLASGGGNFTAGIGFPVGSISMFHGISWGHYYQPGAVHQLRFPIDRNASIDASIRWGSTEQIFEGGVAVGFVYTFGKPYSKQNTKPADW